MERGEDTSAAVDAVTSASIRLAFGDRGVGRIPLDGDIVLFAREEASWQTSVSVQAMAAAERVWAGRGADRGSPESAVACARAALEFDLAFFGLAADWATAVVDVVADGAEVEVAVAVRPATRSVRGAMRRAAVRMELVDGAPTEIEFVLSDDEVKVLDRQELRPEESSSVRGLDALASVALGMLDRALEERGMPQRAFWTLDYSEAPAWEAPAGTCGELAVWTTFPAVGLPDGRPFTRRDPLLP
ncbi:hypothetical protein [Cellulomonas sp. Y8]|uniref:hypothetical protein n=1 Tax=Cellulomonas sp. Y8 TaxID=2591145 RepID=UPI0011CCDDF0|nr:hypothetical protein [Cellulomonas sp. Y8]